MVPRHLDGEFDLIFQETLPAFDLNELVSMSTTATPDSWSAPWLNIFGNIFEAK